MNGFNPACLLDTYDKNKGSRQKQTDDNLKFDDEFDEKEFTHVDPN